MYQGEINSSEEMDGRGILICPKARLIVAHFKENTMHGCFCEILDNGTYRLGWNYDNSLHGKMTILKYDGEVITEYYNKGEKVNYEVQFE